MELSALFDCVRTFAASLAPGDAPAELSLRLSSGRKIRLPVPPAAPDAFRVVLPDYSVVEHRGERYEFSLKQAVAVEALHRACQDGMPGVSGAALLETAESDQKRLRDLFRSGGVTHSAWGTLIVHAGKELYRLDLPECEKV
jgi:hypothetical protein